MESFGQPAGDRDDELGPPGDRRDAAALGELQSTSRPQRHTALWCRRLDGRAAAVGGELTGDAIAGTAQALHADRVTSRRGGLTLEGHAVPVRVAGMEGDAAIRLEHGRTTGAGALAGTHGIAVLGGRSRRKTQDTGQPRQHGGDADTKQRAA